MRPVDVNEKAFVATADIKRKRRMQEDIESNEKSRPSLLKNESKVSLSGRAVPSDEKSPELRSERSSLFVQQKDDLLNMSPSGALAAQELI